MTATTARLHLLAVFKAFFWLCFFILCLGVIILGVLGVYFWGKLSDFTTTAKITPEALHELIKTGVATKPRQTHDRSLFLVLGSDELAGRPGLPTLTDSILLVTVDAQHAKISTLSIPRDLWSSEFKTRFNSLYEYGKKKYPDEPEKLVREALESTLQLKIDYTLVITIEQLQELIDALGGVDVDVKESFVDTSFPRADVDVTVERSPTKLFETISFASGVEHMSGERALKYMRSRHATGTQGSDTARAERQQTVFAAILALTKQRSFFFDTSRLGVLFSFYKKNFDHFFPMTEAIGLTYQAFPKIMQLQFASHELAVFPENPDGVITHPLPNKYGGQWVWEIKDKTKLQEFVKKALF